MISAALSPARLPFLLVLLGVAIFQFTRRNLNKFPISPGIAVLYAAAEAVAQFFVLIVTLFILESVAGAILPAARWAGYLVLLLTVIIAFKPIKMISAYLERQLISH